MKKKGERLAHISERTRVVCVFVFVPSFQMEKTVCVVSRLTLVTAPDFG